MSDLEKEIERLILEKKIAKEAAAKKLENLLRIDVTVPSKEKPTKIVRQKITNKMVIDLLDIDKIIALKEKSAALARKRKNRNAINKELDNLPSKVLSIDKKTDFIKSPNYITRAIIIEQLRRTTTAHKKQMAFLQILIKTGDFEETKNQHQLNYTTCDFGKWFYDKGLMLASFEEYRQLENLHLTVHDYYLRIYKLYNEKIVGTLLTTKAKKIEERQQIADKLWRVLKEKSNIFCENILILENKVKGFTKDQMDTLNIVKRN